MTLALDLCLQVTSNVPKPPVISVPVADTSAVLIPSTVRSATTDFARFLERAALLALRLLRCDCTDRRAGF